MAVSWTKEQQQVIDLNNRDILVSAAAVSGKTAVLVERIIKKITDREHPVDIDQLLVVTFTNAAAAEMRERIRIAIEGLLAEEPENDNLANFQFCYALAKRGCIFILNIIEIVNSFVTNNHVNSSIIENIKIEVIRIQHQQFHKGGD